MHCRMRSLGSLLIGDVHQRSRNLVKGQLGQVGVVGEVSFRIFYIFIFIHMILTVTHFRARVNT